MSAYCYILAGGNHRFDRMDLPISEQESYLKGGVAIGEEAWLGAELPCWTASQLDGAR